MKKCLTVRTIKNFIYRNKEDIFSCAVFALTYGCGCFYCYNQGIKDGKHQLINLYTLLEDRRILRYFDPKSEKEVNFVDTLEIVKRIVDEETEHAGDKNP